MPPAHNGWSRTQIAGHWADVFTPPGEAPHESAVIFLHGRAQQTLATDEVFTKQLARHNLPCVCPHAGRCWWLDTPSPEFDPVVTPLQWIRNELTAWIAETWHVIPPHIGLLGISMGGQGVLQLAYRHARQFPVVAAIAPAVDFHIVHGLGWELDEMFATPEEARQQTVTLNLHPLSWPQHQLIVCDPTDRTWHEGCERLASKLSSTGIPFERDLQTSAGGHSWEYFRAMAPRCIEFVATSLQALQRRH